MTDIPAEAEPVDAVLAEEVDPPVQVPVEEPPPPPYLGPGVDDGTVLKSRVSGGLAQERIVVDYDGDGNEIGWHKEVVE